MQQRKLAGVFSALILVWSIPAFARAQTITTGVLEGVVRDPAGAVMSEVSVIVRAGEGGAVRSIETSHDGMFRFAALPPGTYTVLVERLGYRPKRIENVQVLGGRGVQLQVELAVAPPPVEAPDVSRYGGNSGLSRAGVSEWLTTLQTSNLPWDRRDLTELAARSSWSNDAFEIEGLPAGLSAFFIDGVRYIPARHGEMASGAQRGLALPINGVESAELVTTDADVEWSGFSGGALAAQTRRGNYRFTAEGFGAWSGGPLSTSKFFDEPETTGNSMWGGVVLGGPIIRDTAHFVIGLEGRRLETPFARPWEIDGGTHQALLGATTGLEQFTRPFTLQSTILNGFGRFDWQLSDSHALSVSASFGQIAEPAGQADVARSAFPDLIAEGGDALSTVAITSRLSSRLSNDLRVGFAQSTRDYTGTLSTAGTLLPSTRIVQSGAHFGADPRLPGRFERSGFSVLDALEFPISQHRVRVGVDVDLTSHDQTHVYNQSGEFTFGGPTQFANGQGLFVQSTGPVAAVSYSALTYGAFLQDTWNPAPDLTIVTGARFDISVLPKDDVPVHQEWLTFTGIDTTGLARTVGTLSPRIGATWNIGGQGAWIVHAAAGTYASAVDPSVMSELLTPARSIRRGIGALGSWPNPSAQSTTVANGLSLVGPEFRGPLTVRTSIGIGRRVGPSTMFNISGTYRNTDFLPRRADLNILATPAAHDQNGRAIYGSLVQLGDLVAVGQPNRRFSSYDMVSAVTADGASQYFGVTASLEKELSDSFGYFVTYTYSKTTDNWLGARNGAPEAQLMPFLDDVGDNWRDGRSDFDLPHRVSAGLEVRPRMGFSPRISALYTYRSGYPFTPGFRDGVDVNGDGSGLNDPAFVDPAIPGTQELINDWDCLSDQVAKFADRNACRQPGVHSLNARLAFTLGTPQGTSAEVFVDGINLLESAVGIPDRALYLIDAGRSLSNANGAVTLPLIANPHFGEPIIRSGAGKMLRIGIQVKH